MRVTASSDCCFQWPGLEGALIVAADAFIVADSDGAGGGLSVVVVGVGCCAVSAGSPIVVENACRNKTRRTGRCGGLTIDD